MKIVPSPRSSYVRVKPLGAPPDSYFDFSAFSCHTPTNGSILAGAVVVRGARAVGFGAGFGALCANATVPHESGARMVSASASMYRVYRIELTPWPVDARTLAQTGLSAGLFDHNVHRNSDHLHEPRQQDDEIGQVRRITKKSYP